MSTDPTITQAVTDAAACCTPDASAQASTCCAGTTSASATREPVLACC